MAAREQAEAAKQSVGREKKSKNTQLSIYDKVHKKGGNTGNSYPGKKNSANELSQGFL